MSRRFFEEGDRLFNEPAEDAAEPHEHDELQVRLRIPRRRGAAVAWTLVIVGAVAALLVGGWSSVRQPLLAALSRAEAAIGTRGSPQASPAAPALPAQVRQPASTAPASPAIAAAAPTIAASLAEQAPAPAPAAVATPPTRTTRAPAAEPRASAHASRSPSPSPSALRGYVWSPAEHRLVPANSGAR